MVTMLPTPKQVEAALTPLQAARDMAFSVSILQFANFEPGSLTTQCVNNLKLAAEALGYELVQRVTPAARDGGRMDVEVDEHA